MCVARFQVVLGVHGGALTNVLWCRPGTTVVELGFPAVTLAHYAHMAAALHLAYIHVPVVEDERGVGAPAVEVTPAAWQRLMEALATDLTST